MNETTTIEYLREKIRRLESKLDRIENRVAAAGWELCPRCEEFEHDNHFVQSYRKEECVCRGCMNNEEALFEEKEETAWLASRGLL